MRGWPRWLVLPVAVALFVGASSPAIAQRTPRFLFPGLAIEHVHLELQRGADPQDLHDPLPCMVGCFDASARYPVDRLALTYPVAC